MTGLSSEDTLRAIPEYAELNKIYNKTEKLAARNALDLKYSVQEDLNHAFMWGFFIISPWLLKRDEMLNKVFCNAS